MPKYRIAWLAGDGIGVEVMAVFIKILRSFVVIRMPT